MSHLRHTMSTLTPISASIFVKLGARQVTACPKILQQCRSLPLVHDSGPVSLVQWRTLTSRPHPTIDKVIRVDHAGEFGANRIYAGQVAVLGTTEVGDVIKHMWDQEKEHLDLFRNFVGERRVRPTLLLPVWDLAGYALAPLLVGTQAAGGNAQRPRRLCEKITSCLGYACLLIFYFLCSLTGQFVIRSKWSQRKITTGFRIAASTWSAVWLLVFLFVNANSLIFGLYSIINCPYPHCGYIYTYTFKSWDNVSNSTNGTVVGVSPVRASEYDDWQKVVITTATLSGIISYYLLVMRVLIPQYSALKPLIFDRLCNCWAKCWQLCGETNVHSSTSNQGRILSPFIDWDSTDPEEQSTSLSPIQLFFFLLIFWFNFLLFGANVAVFYVILHQEIEPEKPTFLYVEDISGLTSQFGSQLCAILSCFIFAKVASAVCNECLAMNNRFKEFDIHWDAFRIAHTIPDPPVNQPEHPPPENQPEQPPPENQPEHPPPENQPEQPPPENQPEHPPPENQPEQAPPENQPEQPPPVNQPEHPPPEIQPEQPPPENQPEHPPPEIQPEQPPPENQPEYPPPENQPEQPPPENQPEHPPPENQPEQPPPENQPEHPPPKNQPEHPPPEIQPEHPPPVNQPEQPPPENQPEQPPPVNQPEHPPQVEVFMERLQRLQNDNEYRAHKYLEALKKKDKEYVDMVKSTLKPYGTWFAFHWILYTLTAFMSITYLVESIVQELYGFKHKECHGAHNMICKLDIAYITLFTLEHCILFLYPCFRAAAVTSARATLIKRVSEREWDHIPHSVINSFIQYLKGQKCVFKIAILCAEIPFGFNIAYLSIFIAIFGVILKLSI